MKNLKRTVVRWALVGLATMGAKKLAERLAAEKDATTPSSV